MSKSFYDILDACMATLANAKIQHECEACQKCRKEHKGS